MTCQDDPKITREVCEACENFWSTSIVVKHTCYLDEDHEGDCICFYCEEGYH